MKIQKTGVSVGMIVTLVTFLFDVTGSDYGLWGYPTELVRPGPGALPLI
jgi:hypothetical protein